MSPVTPDKIRKLQRKLYCKAKAEPAFRFMSASPSKKSVQRLKDKVRELLVPSNVDPWPEVREDLNRSLRGWSNYFNLGSPGVAFRSVDHYVRERVSCIPCQTAQGGRARHSSVHVGCNPPGPRRAVPGTPTPTCPAVGLAVKPVGEPYSGNRDLRFDEQRWETGCWPLAPSYRAHL